MRSGEWGMAATPGAPTEGLSASSHVSEELHAVEALPWLLPTLARWEHEYRFTLSLISSEARQISRIFLVSDRYGSV